MKIALHNFFMKKFSYGSTIMHMAYMPAKKIYLRIKIWELWSWLRSTGVRLQQNYDCDQGVLREYLVVDLKPTFYNLHALIL